MNYGELKTLMDRYLKRQDLRDLYDTWAGFTNQRIDMQLRLKEQEYRTISVPLAQFVALPDDYISMRHLATSTDHGRPMQYVTPDQMDIAALRFRSGGPIFYTIVNNQLELIPAPTAESEGTLELFYWAKLPLLTLDADTNKVLTEYPNLYVYGMMMEAAAFRMSDGDAQSYSQLWRDYAKELNDRQGAGRFGANLQMRAS
jgi:hypothetical protein